MCLYAKKISRQHGYLTLDHQPHVSAVVCNQFQILLNCCLGKRIQCCNYIAFHILL